jgi:hypothetical protein
MVVRQKSVFHRVDSATGFQYQNGQFPMWLVARAAGRGYDTHLHAGK